MYLDNAATTPIHPDVIQSMYNALKEVFGNPASKYYPESEKAKIYVEHSRNNLAELLGCSSKDVLFTSGATESNNLIIKGIFFSGNEKRHYITSRAEHSSVLNVYKYLEDLGADVTYINIDKNGLLDLNQLKSSIKENTILVSLHWVNSELGTIQEINDISNFLFSKSIMFHVDATQAIGKLHIDLNDYPGINFLSLSAHKFHGPKGIGAAIIKPDRDGIRIKMTPLFHGGEQENGLRAGTLSVHNIVGMGKAAEIAKKNSDYIENVRIKESRLLKILNDDVDIPPFVIRDFKNRIPGILSLYVPGKINSILLKNVAHKYSMSSGSACSITKPSHVLDAAGFTKEEIRGTLRLSINSMTEIK